MLEHATFSPKLTTADPAAATAPAASPAVADPSGLFGNLIDVINPLHHIPLASTAYRQATGDDIGALARIAGGALFGGPVGAGVAAVNVLIESATGADAGQHLIAALTPEESTVQEEPTVQTAQAAWSGQAGDAPWYLAQSPAAPRMEPGPATTTLAALPSSSGGPAPWYAAARSGPGGQTAKPTTGPNDPPDRQIAAASPTSDSIAAVTETAPRPAEEQSSSHPAAPIQQQAVSRQTVRSLRNNRQAAGHQPTSQQPDKQSLGAPPNRLDGLPELLAAAPPGLSAALAARPPVLGQAAKPPGLTGSIAPGTKFDISRLLNTQSNRASHQKARAITPLQTGRTDFTNAMMSGLDKYRTLQKQASPVAAPGSNAKR